MNLLSLICMLCWVMQILEWILNWALKKRYTASRHDEDDDIEADDWTVLQMARLERKIDGVMTALKNENSKLKAENIRLRTNRLEGHVNDFSNSNTAMTTNFKIGKGNVVEKMKQFKIRISYIRNAMRDLKTQKSTLMATIENACRPDCLEAFHEKMNLFYSNGLNLKDQMLYLVKKHNTMEGIVDTLEGSLQNHSSACGVMAEKVKSLGKICKNVEKRVFELNDFKNVSYNNVMVLEKNYKTLESYMDQLKNQVLDNEMMNVTENWEMLENEMTDFEGDWLHYTDDDLIDVDDYDYAFGEAELKINMEE